MHAKPTGPQRWTRHLSAGGFLGGASLAVVLLSSWLGAGAREASGYVFYPVNYYTGSPGARPAVLWSPDVWAPGQTLSVTLVDSPEWKSTFGSTANAVRFLDREVLGAWSAIETADIRWEIGRVAEEDEAFGETDTYVYRGGGTYGLAVVRDRKMVACRVSLAETKGPHIAAVARHEFGHCLGLQHSGTTTDRPWDRTRDGLLPLSAPQQGDPLMSYGLWQDDGRLTVDDRIGASLIRPRTSWIETTGGVRGVVLPDDDGEVRFLYVLATRLGTDGRPVESVGALTNKDGVFFLAGLAPAQYALTVRPFYIASSVAAYFGGGVTLDIRPSIRARPITVHAGGPRGVTVLRVQRGPEHIGLPSRGFNRNP